MKLKYAFLTASVLLPLCCVSTASAEEEMQLADEVETPDVLLQESDDKAKQVRYGDDDIKLSPQGRKDNAQITPDPLEKNLMPKATKEELEKQALEDQRREEQKRKAKKQGKKDIVKKDQQLKTRPTDDEILTPDPLIDMLN